MISKFALRGLREQKCSRREEGPATILRLSFERKIPVKESSRKETTQLSWSYDARAEL